MLASLADAPLDDPQLVYEPKYDGIRAIAEVPAGAVSPGPVRLWSRLGNDKTSQFPEIAAALERWARRLEARVVLDGEIVALDGGGLPVGFQHLQRRGRPREGEPATGGVAFIAFDLLREGATDLRARPLLERRAALERIFGRTGSPILRLSEMVRGDGRALYRRAIDGGWEGLIAKRAGSVYQSGKRTPDWRKVKIVHEQEFVVGGWTEPRHTRSHFGALLLGVYEDALSPARPGGSHVEATPERGGARASTRGGGAPRDLMYVGHAGTGFDERELERVMTRLRPLETSHCPFRERPRSNERAHWVKPRLVAQVRFTEWTADGKLRHPVYLGLRDDKTVHEIRREENPPPRPATSDLIQQLHAIEESRRDGVIDLPDGERLAVTNLHKVFWPRQKLTKGDLFRYYAEVAPVLLPAVADRPLVMKRYPNGIGGKPFYQHRAEKVPSGVRVERVAVADRRPQLVGGDLKTLLYMTQLAAISQDPWFSRFGSPRYADYVALDLDPMPGVGFARVLDVARWIRDELQSLGAGGVPKTSGADGLHVYIPLPPETPFEAGLVFCQIIATVIARKHPRQATVARAVAARGKTVYVDFLQNIAGKTLATAYSARASEYAGVSTPLTWSEIDDGVRREDFTIRSVPSRLHVVGDLWAALRRAKGVDLARIARDAGRAR